METDGPRNPSPWDPYSNRFTTSPESDEDTVSDAPLERLSDRSPYTGIHQMNHRDLELACSSELVEFRVGPDSALYHLSKPLVCSLSKPLYTWISTQIRRPTLLDWTLFIDKDIFNLFVQFIYRADYELQEHFDLSLGDHREAFVQSMEQSDQQPSFQIYAGSPKVQMELPGSPCREHAQLWAFATEIEFADLADAALEQLLEALNLFFSISGTRKNYLNMPLADCVAVVDVFGYVYFQADRLEKIRTVRGRINPAPVTKMKRELARFARKYMSDLEPNEAQRHAQAAQADNVLGHGTIHPDPQRHQKTEAWVQLLEGHPQIAVDIVRVGMFESDEASQEIVQ
ncbi:hypothetical protein B0T20DRAFT_476812 [Sordaria brevicollis]|uniref:Uncharacterized protein n=1 Tax=Sordaria brevicollis TaxID=83679 RepID=A0AAE0UE37_SORBR|nr:hypothetical protein B0T20DRAFT_476812 [Sordaria brevicollis]